MQELTEKAKEIRRDIFRAICNGGGGHLPTSFSIVELLLVLYSKVLRIDPANPKDPDRDRFVLSKGHGCVALYAVLAEYGFFDKKLLDTHGKKGTILGGHPDMYKVPGVEASTGALGHGFPFAVGMALAGKMDNKDYRVYTILGDGECQEGSVWEAAMFAPQHKIDNLVAVVDYNKFQAMDKLDNIVGLEPFADKWKAFGWEVREVDGHDMEMLVKTFEAVPLKKDKPTLIIAHTIKGKGISFMENTPIWHFRVPKPEEMKEACRELGLDECELDVLKASSV